MHQRFIVMLQAQSPPSGSASVSRSPPQVQDIPSRDHQVEPASSLGNSLFARAGKNKYFVLHLNNFTVT